jgi:hypothetical protein
MDMKIVMDLVVRAVQMIVQEDTDIPLTLMNVWHTTGADEKVLIEFRTYGSMLYIQFGFGGEMKFITIKQFNQFTNKEVLYSREWPPYLSSSVFWYG